MDSELDSKFIVECVKTVVDHSYEDIKGFLKLSKDKFVSLYSNVFEPYVLDIFDRCSAINSFYYGMDKTPLSKIYEPIDVILNSKRISSVSYKDIVKYGNRSLIVGTGGSGKSMLMKHLVIETIRQKAGIPIFLELRDLSLKNFKLINTLNQTLKECSIKLQEKFIDAFCKKGGFVVFIDGYDETPINKRRLVKRSVLEFCKSYPEVSVILASRPDTELHGWDRFNCYRIAPLLLTQAVGLVNRLDYHPANKAKFIKDLKRNLFETHYGFLSNPLLLVIMLITYSVNAKIPGRLSVFFRQAYEALFSRHDTIKGYERKRYTDLDIDQYGRLMSLFCLLTYSNRAISFSESEAVSYLRKSLRLIGYDCRPESFLSDLIKCTCLLIEDGLQITFSHRAFQEFFVAKYIAESQEKKAELVRKIAVLNSDYTLDILYDLDPESVEKYYIIPALVELKKTIGCTRTLNYSSYIGVLRYLLEEYAHDSYGDVIAVKTRTSGANYLLGFCAKWILNLPLNAVNMGSAFYGDYSPSNGFRVNVHETGVPYEHFHTIMKSDTMYSYENIDKFMKLDTQLVNKHDRKSQSLASILGI